MIIDLNSLDGLPIELLTRLSNQVELFKSFNSIEELIMHSTINSIISDIDKVCLSNQIIGYHFTNAIPSDFEENGLKIRTGEEIRQDFIRRFFHLFEDDEQSEILNIWKESYNPVIRESRDNKVFFNFTLLGLESRDAEDLLKYYGGEQIYFYLVNGEPSKVKQSIGLKLTRIGEPLIIKSILNPNKVNTFINQPWGKIAISTYHRKVNIYGSEVDQDGYILLSDISDPEKIKIFINRPNINH